MGDGADHLTEWAEESWTDEHESSTARRQAKVRFKKSKKSRRGPVHNPATDAEAMELIESLGTYVWDTHKVTGRFTHNPYSITSTVNGVLTTINLPGRFGRTLSWLKDQLDREAHR